MGGIGAVFGNHLFLFIVMAIFSTFALLGYLVDAGKLGEKPEKKETTLEDNLEEIKNNLANSNKSLNSMMFDNNKNSGGFNGSSSSSGNGMSINQSGGSSTQFGNQSNNPLMNQNGSIDRL